MLRRWIPLIVLAVAGLLSVADAASAGPRRSGRNWDYSSYEPGYYYYGSQVVTEGQPFVQQTVQPYVMTDQQEFVPAGSRRQARRGYGSYAPVAQTMPTRQTAEYRSYFRVPTPDAPAGTVLFNIQVPETAVITFNGDKTSQTGTVRQFVTPQLDPSRIYTYEIKASWMEAGREIIRTRKIQVRAGELEVVNFLQPTQQELGGLPVQTR